jgi:WD40 repeat protein
MPLGRGYVADPHPLPGRRYLIAIGSAKFDDAETWAALERVRAELERIVAFFTDPGQGYVRVLGREIPLNADAARIRRQLCRWFASPERRSDDQVVIYFTGHGEQSERLRNHYLITRSSRLADLPGTAIRTSELAEWILDGVNDRPENLLVMLDVCYAGHGGGQLVALTGSVTNEVFRNSDAAGLHVIASARAPDQAAEGKFVDALLATIDDETYAGRSQPHVAVEDLFVGIGAWLKAHPPEDGAPQVAEWHHMGQRGVGVAAFIKNPRSRRGMAGRPLADESHWDPKARGVEFATETGWFFTGRRRALTELVEYLTGTGTSPGARLLTGGPGSGKSAVLARLVTCSHPASRRALEDAGALAGVPEETIAPTGSIDVAIHARELAVGDLAARLADAIGAPSAEVGTVVKHLRDHPRRITIVVDALDEALDPDGVDLELLRPLAQLSSVRLVVGARRSKMSTSPLGPNASEIDLDDPKLYFSADDLTEYTMSRLRRRDPPGAFANADDDLIREVAGRVADRAGQSFLYARVVSRALAAADEPPTAKELEELPEDIDEAYDRDLDRFPDAQRSKFFDLLVPLAYAHGRGLPWLIIWPRLAGAIANTLYDSNDVRELLKVAGYYVVEDVEAGISVYRPFHESLGTYLRRRTAQQDIDRTIANTLVELATPPEADQPDWPSEHRGYLLTHLATHAASDPGLLSRLIDDPTYLTHADPSRLLDAIDKNRRHGPEHLARVHRVLRLAHYQLRRHDNPAVRGSYLQLAARQLGEDNLAERVAAAHDLPWSTEWAHWTPDLSLTLGRHGRPGSGFFQEVRDIKIAVLDGRPVVLSASQDGTVRRWDLATGAERQPALEPSTRHRTAINSLAMAEIDERTMVAACDSDGHVYRWDLATGTAHNPIELPQPDAGILEALAIDDTGPEPIIIASRSNQVWRWRARDGKPLGKPHTLAGKRRITSLAVAREVDPPLLLAGRLDGDINVLDLRTLEAIHTLRGHTGRVSSLATTSIGETPIVVSASDSASDGSIRIWDLTTRRERIPAIEDAEYGIRGICPAVLDGVPVLMSAGEGLRLWDLDTGAFLGRLLGHEGLATAVTAVEVDGSLMVVSGGYDGTVRRWDPSDFSPDIMEFDPFGAVGAAAVGRVRECDVAVAAKGHGRFQLWDLLTGSELGSAGLPDISINRLGIFQRGDRLIVVLGGMDGTIYQFDHDTGRLDGPTVTTESMARDPDPVAGMTVVEVDSAPVVISTGKQLSDRSTLLCWDPIDGRLLGRERWVAPIINRLNVAVIDGCPMLLALTNDPMILAWDASDLPDLGPLDDPRVLKDLRPSTTVSTFTTLEHAGRTLLLTGGWDRAVSITSLEGPTVFAIELDTVVNDLAAAAGRFVVASNKGVLCLRLGPGFTI